MMKSIIDSIKSDSLAISFFLFVTIIILWQMLLPGYILTLDMVFTPQLRTYLEPGSFANLLVVKFILATINLIIPAWIIQKLILIAIFFCSGYFAYKFIPVPKQYGAALWAGLFYMANPFVYQRLLAGQWYVLMAYAFLPVLFYLIFSFLTKPNFKKSLLLAATFFLISLFSLHFLVIGLVALSVVSLIYLTNQLYHRNYKYIKDFFTGAVLGGLVLVLASSFWLVPFILNQSSSIVSAIDQRDFMAFATATDASIGTVANVFSLYGFWGEALGWSGYFLWPKANFVFWLPVSLILASIILTGAVAVLRRQDKIQGLSFLVMTIVAAILSAGVGESAFKNINQWLFDHLWFWSGLRDTQKFSALLALSYAYFGGFGFFIMIKKIKKVLPKIDVVIFILMIVPVMYTYTLFGGFSRQLQPVWYPASWQETAKILAADTSDYRVLFLPWHQYLSFDFNRKLLIQNPAKDYFGSKIIQGENIELESIYSKNINPEVEKVEQILANSGVAAADEIIENLAKISIKYIIFSHDLDEVSQPIDFDPSRSSKVRLIKDFGDLTIYEIML